MKWENSSHFSLLTSFTTMATEKQIAANRANALKSTGPKTIAGRQKSARNSLKHGLQSRNIVMDHESQEDLLAFVESFKEALEPQDPIELAVVEKMATARWHQRRLWTLEKTTLQQEIHNQDRITVSDDAAEPDVVEPVAFASYTTSNRSRVFDLITRFEVRLDRQYWHAFDLLERMKKQNLHKRTQCSTPSVAATSIATSQKTKKSTNKPNL